MKIGWVVIFVTVAACSKAPAPLPRVSMPSDIVAVISVPSLDGALPGLIDFVDKVKPGKGTELRSEIDEEIGAEIADAIDRARPMHLIIVAPPAGVADPGIVVVAAVRDAAKLAKMKSTERDVRLSGRWVAIGEPAVVDRTWRWALGTLATGDPPASPSMSAFPAAIRDRWEGELRTQLDPGGSPAKTFARDAVLGLLAQTARVDAKVELADGAATVDIALTPRADTALAAVLAAQKPATFALLERLPLESPLGVMAMHMSLGPFAAPVRGLITTLITSELDEFGPRTAELFETVWSIGTGEYAGVTIGGSAIVINAIGVSDPARVHAELQSIAKAVTTIEIPGGRFVVEPLTHDGVAISVGKMVADATPGAIGGSWATWDNTLAFALSDLDGAVLRSTIDGSRGKPAVPPVMAKVISDARKRGDCFLQTVDVLPGEQPPLSTAFGVRDGVGHLWMHIPGEQAGTMVKMVPSSDE